MPHIEFFHKYFKENALPLKCGLFKYHVLIRTKNLLIYISIQKIGVSECLS